MAGISQSKQLWHLMTMCKRPPRLPVIFCGCARFMQLRQNRVGQLQQLKTRTGKGSGLVLRENSSRRRGDLLNLC